MSRYYCYFLLTIILVIGLGVGPTSAQLLPVIELDLGQEDVRILGDDAADYLGYAVASGDINGDGIDDLIIGAVNVSQSISPSAGEVNIIYGQYNLSGTIDFDVVDPDVRILGEDEYGFCGYAVACGAVNGDGYDDIIIGAPGLKYKSGPDAGKTYIIYGGDGVTSLPAIIDLSKGEEDVCILRDDADDGLGHAVACGDINGDGFDDIVVGADWANQPGGPERAGETYIIYGGDGATSLPPIIDLDAGDEMCAS